MPFTSSMTVDQIAELAKKELDAAEAGVEHARRQLQEAEERHARANDQFVEADLQRNSSWNIMYQHLLDYKQAHGDVLVLTSKDSSPDVKKLSKWVQNQRVHYKYHMNGDTKHIKKHRIDALNKIGFVWSTLEHAWDINFADLKSFHEEHGNFDVTKKHGARLNSFVTNIRKAMRRKKEGLHQKDLTEGRINRLNSINFTWDPKRPIKQKSAGESPQYDELYNLLVDFKQHYGHVKVAKMISIWRNGDEGPPKPEYKRLTSFIGSVRYEYLLFLEGKPCLLDAEKVRRLTELGVKWKRPASEPRKNCGVTKERKTRLMKKSEKDEIDDNDDDNADVEDDVEQVEVDDNDNDNADGDDDVEQVEDDDTANQGESMADHAESKTHQTFDI